MKPNWLSRDLARAPFHYWEKVDLACIVGILAHEATHLWQRAKEYLGEKAPSAEFEAYSIQGFTQSLFEEFQRQTKEKHHE